MTKQEIIGMNIVIVNNQIDTNLFSQYWFIENKIFEMAAMSKKSNYANIITN